MQGPTDATSRSTTDSSQIRDFAIALARSLADNKCEHIVILDVRELSQVSEYIIVATGTSDRQMNSAIDHLEEIATENGFPTFRTNKDDRSTWLLADFVDVVAHLFEPNTRAHYDLETMWGDAPRLAWKRENDAKSDHDDEADG